VGFAKEERGSSGVVRECSCFNWVCTVPRIVWGFDVISFEVGSRIVLELGWSFALGCRSVAVLR